LKSFRDWWGDGAPSPKNQGGAAAPPYQKLKNVRKELDLVWVWFYKDVSPTALFKGANPSK
jgi:hypothetical protein